MEIAPLDGVEELYSIESYHTAPDPVDEGSGDAVDFIFYDDPLLDPRCKQGPDIPEKAPCGCVDENGIIKYKDGKAIPEYQTGESFDYETNETIYGCTALYVTGAVPVSAVTSVVSPNYYFCFAEITIKAGIKNWSVKDGREWNGLPVITRSCGGPTKCRSRSRKCCAIPKVNGRGICPIRC